MQKCLTLTFFKGETSCVTHNMPELEKGETEENEHTGGGTPAWQRVNNSEGRQQMDRFTTVQ